MVTATKKSIEIEPDAMIFEIQKLSTEDGPGIRTTVFFKECPLKCAWCHNPESIEPLPSIQWYKNKCINCEMCVSICPNSALTMDQTGLHIDRIKCTSCGTCVKECPSTALKSFGEKWEIKRLVEEISKDEAYYFKSGGGITVSGGEPTLQRDFLIKFLRICKDKGYSTALDTCGLASQETYVKLLPFVDLILYDLKEIDPHKHKLFTGVSNVKILDNCKWLVKNAHSMGKSFWIRTPLIPTYTGTAENVRGLADFIVNHLENKIERWDLLAFNNLAAAKYHRMDLDWPLEGLSLYTKAEMEYFYNIAVEMGVNNVQWSGLTK